MAERANYIHIRNGVTSYRMDRWGGHQVWIDGLTEPSVVLKRFRTFSPQYENWQSCLDGAVLIDEDNYQLVIGICFRDSKPDPSDFSHDNYMDSAFFNKLYLRDCQLVRDCYIEILSQVWKGWQVKLVELDFAETKGAINNFDNISNFPNGKSHDCPLTKLEVYALFIRRFFKWNGFPLKATCQLVTNQSVEKLLPLESRVEERLNDFLQSLNDDYKQTMTQSEINKHKKEIEVVESERDIVYQTIFKAYQAVLQSEVVDLDRI